MITGFQKQDPKGPVQIGDSFITDACGDYPIGSTFLTPAGHTLFGPILATIEVLTVQETDIRKVWRIEGRVVSI